MIIIGFMFVTLQSYINIYNFVKLQNCLKCCFNFRNKKATIIIIKNIGCQFTDLAGKSSTAIIK